MPEERVDPKVLNSVLLTDIADSLYQLQKLAEAEVPKGAVEPIEKFTITSVRRHIINKKWFSFTLVNDGPNSVFVIVNTEKSFDEHEVLNGETYAIDFHRPIIVDFLMWCNPGETASVRLVGAK